MFFFKQLHVGSGARRSEQLVFIPSVVKDTENQGEHRRIHRSNRESRTSRGCMHSASKSQLKWANYRSTQQAIIVVNIVRMPLLMLHLASRGSRTACHVFLSRSRAAKRQVGLCLSFPYLARGWRIKLVVYSYSFSVPICCLLSTSAQSDSPISPFKSQQNI
jgi:hypothetical protein